MAANAFLALRHPADSAVGERHAHLAATASLQLQVSRYRAAYGRVRTSNIIIAATAMTNNEVIGNREPVHDLLGHCLADRWANTNR